MNQFNWWRRGYKKKRLADPKHPINGKSVLLQKIERGDYEISGYYTILRAERLKTIRLIRETKSKYNYVSSDTLAHKVRQVEFAQQKRLNRLMDDYVRDEARLLNELQTKLKNEFNQDVWDVAVEDCMQSNATSTLDLYKAFAKHSSIR